MMHSIGFIGVGIMGKSMVRNLLNNGFEIHIYARTKAKAEELLNEGAQWSPSISECARGRDAIITIVGFPSDVEEVYLRDDNILDNAGKGTILIDMTTTSPDLDMRICREAEKRGLEMLDAPVTGGDTGAKAGSLTILVGGKKNIFENCLPLFTAMGKNIVYEGPSGNGQHTKMVNQIMIAGTMSGICEGFAYAKKSGLDMEKVFKAVSTGAAASAQLTSNGPKILAENYEPGFFLKHFIKDLDIADKEAIGKNLELPILRQVLSEYKELAKRGLENEGTQALSKYYE